MFEVCQQLLTNSVCTKRNNSDTCFPASEKTSRLVLPTLDGWPTNEHSSSAWRVSRRFLALKDLPRAALHLAMSTATPEEPSSLRHPQADPHRSLCTDRGPRSRSPVLPHLSTMAHPPRPVQRRAQNQCVARSARVDVSGPPDCRQFPRSSSGYGGVQAQNRYWPALVCCLGAAHPHRYSNALAQTLGTQVSLAAIRCHR